MMPMKGNEDDNKNKQRKKVHFIFFCSWSLTTLSCLRGNQRRSLLEKVNSLHHHDEYLHLDGYLHLGDFLHKKNESVMAAAKITNSVSLYLYLKFSKLFQFSSYIILFLLFFHINYLQVKVLRPR